MSGKQGLVVLAAIGVWAAAAALAQNASSAVRQPYDGSDSFTGPRPIHIDQNCKIVPRQAEMPPGKKAKPYNDDAICYLEGQLESEHWEEKINGNVLNRWFVRVKEQTYVLQDVADEPVMFIVQQPIPKDWFVDSDPQPWQVVGQTAYFHVYVKPGETIRLHVGVRREWPQKPKPI